MKTVQMTLDEELVANVDKVVNALHTTRSAFTRQALKLALENYNVQKLEEKQRKGYKLFPSKKNEFSIWEKEQEWGDA